MAITNKDRAVFWLNRRIKELESRSTPPAHEDMAMAGMSYEARQRAIAAREKDTDNVKGELEALREVAAFVMEKA